MPNYPKKDMYKIKVYVDHGYFEYEVNNMEQAIAHGEVIMTRQTYRRVNSNNEVEIHHVQKVKICGEGLETEYPDTFKRT